jgi:hypothetical protein
VGERPRAGDGPGEWGAADRGGEPRGQRGGKARRRRHFLRAVVLPVAVAVAVVLGLVWRGRAERRGVVERGCGAADARRATSPLP